MTTIPQTQRRDASGKQIRGIPAAPTSINEANRSIDYVCSTEALDSHGTILRQNWDLKRYQANPVVLFAHKQDRIPVGRAANVRVENRQLLATLVFATEEEGGKEAEEVWRAAKSGLLRGVSVGFDWRTYRWEMINGAEVLVFDDLELLELSVCPVGSNPEALARSADDTNRPVLERLRSERRFPSPSPHEEPPSMTPEQIEALKAQLRAVQEQNAAHTRELDLLRAAGAKEAAALAEARAVVEKAQADLAGSRTEVGQLKGLVERLNGEADALKKRADVAEDKLARNEIETRIGKNVDPAEVDDLLAVRRVNPEAFARMLARRDGRDDRLTDRVIPPEGRAPQGGTPPAGGAGAPPPAGAPAPDGSLRRAIEKHMPPELPAKG